MKELADRECRGLFIEVVPEQITPQPGAFFVIVLNQVWADLMPTVGKSMKFQLSTPIILPSPSEDD